MSGLERQQWLEQARDALASRFIAAGYTIPDNVRVGFGWPRGSHGKGRAIGQCWGAVSSEDGHNECFISPALGVRNGATPEQVTEQSARIVDVLAHELVHATVGVEAGHKAEFKRAAVAIGLDGKMTATIAGPELAAWCRELVSRIGAFPTGGLNEHGRKKQGTRLLKAVCPACEYTVRVTAKWINEAGAPICPSDGEQFQCE